MRSRGEYCTGGGGAYSNFHHTISRQTGGDPGRSVHVPNEDAAPVGRRTTR